MGTKKDQGLTIFLVTASVLTVLCLLAGIVYWLSEEVLPVNPVMVMIGFSLSYLLVSWRFWDPIPADQIGARSILGKPYDTVTAGPPFTPLGVVDIEVYPTPTQQREFPAEPSMVYFPAEGESDTPPDGSGLVRALRITFANQQLTKEKAEMVFGENYKFTFNNQEYVFDHGDTDKEDGLSNARVTAVVFHICRFRIFDPIQFTISVPPHSKTGNRIDEAFRQIEDEQAVALTAILAQMTVAQAILNIGWINAVLFRKVCRRIGAPHTTSTNPSGTIEEAGHSSKWGIDLEGTAVKPFEFNRSLNKDITGVAQATFNAVSTVRTAEAARKAAILAGEGAAKAAKDLEQGTLEGRAAGLAKVGETLEKEGGREALAAEVARSLGASGNTIVVGTEGLKELIGLATAARKDTKTK